MTAMIRDTAHQDTVLVPSSSQAYKRRAAWALAVLAAAGACIGVFGAWRGSEASVSAARLRIAEVTRGTLVRDTAVNGRVVAAVSPTLYAKAGATVNLKVAAGDTVQRGQVLAVLESPDLADALKREISTCEQLKAEVARQQILARKQKLLAQRDADTAEIDRLSAQRTLERYDSVVQTGVIAKIDYQKARDALQSAEIRARHAGKAALLEADDVQLALATKRAELERAQLALGEARRRVDELTVRAPAAGLIGLLNVQDRSVVPANAPLMTLIDLSRLEVEIEVPESYVADLGLGMRAEIALPGGTAAGRLTALSPEVVKNMVLARLRFDGAQPAGLRQSQRLTARLLIEEKPNVLLLPRGSFVDNDGGRTAWVVRDGVAVRTPIRLGATSLAAVEIAAGLKQGDQVVVSGTDTFGNATRVAINR
jgi:HlyD family secretion protein